MLLLINFLRDTLTQLRKVGEYLNNVGSKLPKVTSTSSCEVKLEWEPMMNNVGVFSSNRGSSTP